MTMNHLSLVWSFFRSQKLGLVCCFTSVFFLGFGSFLMAARQDVYGTLGLDDFRFFFQPLRWLHAWFYLLAASLAVWGMSSLVCALDTLAKRIRGRAFHPAAFGPILLHVAFFLALVAHLWGGLAAETGQRVVTPAGTELEGAIYRAVSLSVERHPTGMPRQISAILERTSGAGAKPEPVTIAYNQPLVFEAGAREYLLGNVGQTPVAKLRSGGEELELSAGEAGRLGSAEIRLSRLYTGPKTRMPVAFVTTVGASPIEVALPLGGKSPDGKLEFAGLRTAPYVVLTKRTNPSVPLVLLVTLLLVAGVGLTVWKRLRRGSRAAA